MENVSVTVDLYTNREDVEDTNISTNAIFTGIHDMFSIQAVTKQMDPGLQGNVTTHTTQDTGIQTHIRVAVTEVQIVYMLIGIIGIIGNIFAIIVFLSNRKMRQTMTNQFLIHQSVIDLISSIFVLATIPLKKDQQLTGVSGYIICVFWNTSFMVWSMLLVSTYNLVALSLEKWLKIAFPLLHRAYFSETIAYIMMAGSWVIGFVYQIAIMTTTSAVIDGKCYPLVLWSSPFARKTLGVVSFLVKLLIPVTLIGFCYISMMFAIRKSRNNTGQQTDNKRMEKAQRNIFKTLVVVVICFILCVTVNQILFLLFNTGLFKLDFSSTYYNFSVIMYFVNCCINPVIYFINYNEFRKSAKRLISKNSVGDGQSTLATVT